MENVDDVIGAERRFLAHPFAVQEYVDVPPHAIVLVEDPAGDRRVAALERP